MDWSALHFMRPWWFLGILPVAVLLVSLRSSNAKSPWQKTCDDHLLEHLWLTPPGGISHRFLLLLATGWLVTIIALAGPVWERQPQPVFQADLSRVILLDLSDSMNAVDISPSRLQRARFKLSDILKRSREGRTSLIVFAGEAHIVTPLTSDTETIETMIPALVTDIVPARGSSALPALDLAQQLLSRTPTRLGQVILITDGVDDMAGSLKAMRRLDQMGFPVSVLGVGTTPGAPIPDSDGGFGAMSRLVPAELIELANAGGGEYSPITADGEDLEKVLSDLDDPALAQKIESEAEVERWVEHGIWLLPLVLLLASTGMRKGWLGIVLVAMIIPLPSEAADWPDLWLRKDQQGLRSLNKNQPERAAELFESPGWRATALHQAGQFDQAAAAFAEVPGPEADYNRGNALARAGHLEKAVAAYKEVLEVAPNHADAQFNLKLVEDLLKKNQPPEKPPESEQKNPPPPPDQDENQPKSPPPEEQPGKDGSDDQSKSQPERERQQDQQEPEKDDAEAARKDAEQQMKQNQQKEQQQGQNRDQPPEQPGEESQSPPPSVAKGAGIPNDEPPADPNLDQWLRQVPDDPSGLLRRKFMLEHLRRKEGESPQ